MAAGLSLLEVPDTPKQDFSAELESPEEQRRLARGFRWYAQALETTAQDGLFLLERPNLVYLLDFDVLRAFLSPIGMPADIVGLINAFLNHESTLYAIPLGCFEELVDWLTPLRQQIQEFRAAWSNDFRQLAEARISQSLRISSRDYDDRPESSRPNGLNEVLIAAERLEGLLSTDRFRGFADSYENSLASALQEQLSKSRDKTHPAGPPHDKRDSCDAINIAVARVRASFTAKNRLFYS